MEEILKNRHFPVPAMTTGFMNGCDLTTDYLEFRKILCSRNEPVRHLPSGSFFELPLLYVISNPTDIDIMYCDMTLCAVFNHVNVPARCARNVLTIDATDCHVGFVRLKNGETYLRKPFNFHRGPSILGDLPLQETCFGAVLGNMNFRWRDIQALDRDNVYALSCTHWPPEASEWITRKRLNGWPTKTIVESIVKSGFHLVSKPHGKSPTDGTQWRYSFSQAEVILIHNWTHVQKYIYHLIRIIKRDVVMKCGGANMTFLTNYHFKTLMLWACENKPSEFWEERNIVTSAKEIIVNLIQKLIDRNITHYFLSTNNIMDDLPYDTNFDNEISLLLDYREEDIVDIERKEPKAYKMDTGFNVIPNSGFYPLLAKLSYNILHPISNEINDRQLQVSRTLSIASSNYFYPELEYLHKGIMMHLELSKLNRYWNEKCRDDYNVFAEKLFDRSMEKLDYGLTRVRLHLGWSFFEICQEFYSVLGKECYYNQNLIPYSGLRLPWATATSCYLRDADDYLRNLRLCSSNGGKSIRPIFHILQDMMLSETALPFNSTYVVCSAFKANFFFNAVGNYRRALDVCNKVKEVLLCIPGLHASLFEEFLPFPLEIEWCDLYDMYIQIVLGFLTLCRFVIALPRAIKRMLPVNICAFQYLRYIYTRCCSILNEPMTDNGFGYGRLHQHKISILRFEVDFSNAFLQTALYISQPCRYF